MAQQEGPFSEYLQQAKLTPPIEVPKPTGLEGTGAAIGNIAMNFINGLRQGRQQKYMQQQMQEQRKFDAYQDAIKAVAASGLTKADKDLLHAQLTTPLIQRIAGDKEATSKHTGNPITDVLKNMAVGIVGGNIPKKGADLPMDPVVTAYRMVSDPSRSESQIAAKHENRIRDRVNTLIKENPYAESRDILKDPEISAVQKEAETALGLGRFTSPTLDRLYKELSATSPMEKIKMDFLQQALGTPSGTPPPAKSQTQVPTAEATITPPAKQEAEQAAPFSGFKIPKSSISKAATASQVTGIPLYKEGTTTEEFETPSGERLVGKNISVNVNGKMLSGIYDDSNETLYPISSLKRIRPGGGTTKEIQSAYDDIVNQVSKSLTGLSGPVKNSLLAEADSYRKTGDIKALKELPQRATKMLADEAREKAAESRQLAAFSQQDKRQAANFENQATMAEKRAVTATATNFQANPIVKGYNQVDALMQGVVFTPKLEEYLKNPSKIKLSQADLTLMDKNLARAASKATDPQTGVKQQEEEGYNNLLGIIKKYGIKLDSVINGQSTLGNYETRKALYDMLSTIYQAQKRKVDNVREQYMGIVSWADPELVKKSFMVGTPVSPEPAPGGTQPPPAAGGGKPKYETRGARSGEEAQSVKKPADI